MHASLELDQKKDNEAIRTEIASRLRSLLSTEASELPSSIERLLHQLNEANQTEKETTDPLAVRLLQDIISEMEIELKEQVDRLFAERYRKVRTMAKQRISTPMETQPKTSWRHKPIPMGSFPTKPTAPAPAPRPPSNRPKRTPTEIAPSLKDKHESRYFKGSVSSRTGSGSSRHAPGF
jgi:hypothetical protein